VARGVFEVIRVMNRPCREHAPLISRLVDDELPRATRVGLVLHFVLCSPCRHFAQQLRFFKRAAARLPGGAAERILEGSAMPPPARERVLGRLGGRR
jgi:hypothetical protein